MLSIHLHWFHQFPTYTPNFPILPLHRRNMLSDPVFFLFRFRRIKCACTKLRISQHQRTGNIFPGWEKVQMGYLFRIHAFWSIFFVVVGVGSFFCEFVKGGESRNTSGIDETITIKWSGPYPFSQKKVSSEIISPRYQKRINRSQDFIRIIIHPFRDIARWES
jgi:hypothetical protein